MMSLQSDFQPTTDSLTNVDKQKTGTDGYLF